MPSAEFLFDNPVLVKHLRSRLRPAQVAPWLAVALILCLCIVWAGQAFGIYANGVAMSLILGLEVLILVFAGAQQVGGSIGGARESGILDFHRVSPQPPSWLAFGFFLGAPVREYLLFAVTVPFALLIAFLSPAGVGVLFGLWVALLFAAWIIHAIALLGGLVSKKPKGATRGGIAGIFILAIFLGQPISGGIYFAATRLQTNMTIPFFGVPLPWVLFVLIYEVVILGFLFLASARRMRSETAHVYTKAEALGCMAVLTLVLLGGFWGYEQVEGLVLAMIYALTAAACVLVATVTPGQAEYVRGLRRAFHAGRRRPSVWSDEGTNQVVTYALAALILVGCTITWEVIVGRDVGGPTTYSQTIAVAVFVAAYFGLGLQYFRLRLPKSGTTYFTLFLFLVWLLPIMVGSISIGAGVNKDIGPIILALSPLAGVFMSSGLVNETFAESARLAALAPAISFAFLFAFLLVNLQRRLDRAVKQAAGLIKKAPGPFDYLDQDGPSEKTRQPTPPAP